MDFSSLDIFWIYLILGWLILIFAVVLFVRYLRSRRKRKRGKGVDEKTQPTRARSQIMLEVTPALDGDEFGLQLSDQSGITNTLRSLPITIGRSSQNDIILVDDTVSDQHARIYYDEIIGNVCIQDLDSNNGTWINDLPTQKNILYDGVRLRFGSAELEYRDTGYIHQD